MWLSSGPWEHLVPSLPSCTAGQTQPLSSPRRPLPCPPQEYQPNITYDQDQATTTAHYRHGGVCPGLHLQVPKAPAAPRQGSISSRKPPQLMHTLTPRPQELQVIGQHHPQTPSPSTQAQADQQALDAQTGEPHACSTSDSYSAHGTIREETEAIKGLQPTVGPWKPRLFISAHQSCSRCSGACVHPPLPERSQQSTSPACALPRADPPAQAHRRQDPGPWRRSRIHKVSEERPQGLWWAQACRAGAAHTGVHICLNTCPCIYAGPSVCSCV